MMRNFDLLRHTRARAKFITAVALLASVSALTQTPPPPDKKDHGAVKAILEALGGGTQPVVAVEKSCLVDFQKDLRYFPEPELEAFLDLVEKAQRAKETALLASFVKESEFSARLKTFSDAGKTKDVELLDLAIFAFQRGENVPAGYLPAQWKSAREFLAREVASRAISAGDGTLLKHLPNKLRTTPAQVDIDWMFTDEALTAAIYDRWLEKKGFPSSREGGLKPWKQWLTEKAGKLGDLKIGEMSYADLSILKEHLLNQFDVESMNGLKEAFKAKYPDEFVQPDALTAENRAEWRRTERRAVCQAPESPNLARDMSDYVARFQGERGVIRHGLPLENRVGLRRQSSRTLTRLDAERRALLELAVKHPQRKLLPTSATGTGLTATELLEFAFRSGARDLTAYLKDVDTNTATKGGLVDRAATLAKRQDDAVEANRERLKLEAAEREKALVKIKQITGNFGRTLSPADLASLKAMPIETLAHFAVVLKSIDGIAEKNTATEIFKALTLFDGRGHLSLDPNALSRLVQFPIKKGEEESAAKAWKQSANEEFREHFLGTLTGENLRYTNRASLHQTFGEFFKEKTTSSLAQIFCEKDPCSEAELKAGPSGAELAAVYRLLKTQSLATEHESKLEQYGIRAESKEPGDLGKLQNLLRGLNIEFALFAEEFKKLDDHVGACTIGAPNCRVNEANEQKVALAKRYYAAYEHEKKALLAQIQKLSESENPEDGERAKVLDALVQRYHENQKFLTTALFKHLTPRNRAENEVGAKNGLVDIKWVCPNGVEYSEKEVPERLLYSPNDLSVFLTNRFVDQLLEKVEPDAAKRARLKKGEFEVDELRKRLKEADAYNATFSESAYKSYPPGQCVKDSVIGIREGVAWLALLHAKANSFRAGLRTSYLLPSIKKMNYRLAAAFEPHSWTTRVQITLKTMDPALRAEVDRLMALAPSKVASTEGPRLSALAQGNPTEQKRFSDLLAYFRDFPDEHAVRRAVYAYTVPEGWSAELKQAFRDDETLAKAWAKAPNAFLSEEHARVSMGFHDPKETLEALVKRVQRAIDENERRYGGTAARDVAEQEKNAEIVEVKSTLAAHKSLVEDAIANFFKPVIEAKDQKELERFLENPKLATAKVFAFVKEAGHSRAEAVFALGQARAYFSWNLLVLQARLGGKPIAGTTGLDARLEKLIKGQPAKTQQRLVQALAMAIHGIDAARDPKSDRAPLDVELAVLDQAFQNASKEKKAEFQKFVNELGRGRREHQDVDPRVGIRGRVRNTAQLNSDTQLLGLQNCEMFLRLHAGAQADGTERAFTGLSSQSKIGLSVLAPVMADFAKELCRYDWSESGDGEATRVTSTATQGYKWDSNASANDAIHDFIQTPNAGSLYFLMVQNESVRRFTQARLTSQLRSRSLHLNRALAVKRLRGENTTELEDEKVVFDILAGEHADAPPWSDLGIPLGMKGLLEFLPKLSGADREKLRDWAATQLMKLVGASVIESQTDEKKLIEGAIARLRAGGNPLAGDVVQDYPDFTKHMLVMMLNLIDESGDSESGKAGAALESAKGGPLRFDPIYVAVRLNEERKLKPKTPSEMYSKVPTLNYFRSLDKGFEFHHSRLLERGGTKSADALIFDRLFRLPAGGKNYSPKTIAETDWSKMPVEDRASAISELLTGVDDALAKASKLGALDPETDRLARDFRRGLVDLVAEHGIKISTAPTTTGVKYAEPAKRGGHFRLKPGDKGFVAPPPTEDVPKRVAALHAVLVGEDGNGGIFDLMEKRAYRSLSAAKRRELAGHLKDVLSALENDKAVARELRVGTRVGRADTGLAAVLPDMIRQLEHEDAWPTAGVSALARAKTIFGLETYWLHDILSTTAGKNWAEVTAAEKKTLREKLVTELKDFDANTKFHTDLVGFIKRNRAENVASLESFSAELRKIALSNPAYPSLRARYETVSRREEYYAHFLKTMKKDDQPLVSDLRRLHSEMINYIDWEEKNPKATDEEKKEKRKGLNEAQARAVMFIENIQPPSELSESTKPVVASAEQREVPVAVQRWEAKQALKQHLASYQSELKTRRASGGPAVDGDGKVPGTTPGKSSSKAFVGPVPAPKNLAAPTENQKQLATLLDFLARREHQAKGLNVEQRIAILKRDVSANRALIALHGPLASSLGTQGIMRTKELWQGLVQNGTPQKIAEVHATLLPNDRSVATSQQLDLGKIRAAIRADISANGAISQASKKQLAFLANHDVLARWLPERIAEVFSNLKEEEAESVLKNLEEKKMLEVVKRASEIEHELRIEVVLAESRKFRAALTQKVGKLKASEVLGRLHGLLELDGKIASQPQTPAVQALLKDKTNLDFIRRVRHLLQFDPSKEYIAHIEAIFTKRLDQARSEASPEATIEVEDLEKVLSDFIPQLKLGAANLSRTHDPIDAVTRAWGEVLGKFRGNKQMEHALGGEVYVPDYALRNMRHEWYAATDGILNRVQRHTQLDNKFQPHQWCLERTQASWEAWKKAESDRVKEVSDNPAVLAWKKHQNEARTTLSDLSTKEFAETTQLKRAISEIEIVEQKLKGLNELKKKEMWNDSKKITKDMKDTHEAHIATLKKDLELRRERLEQAFRELKKFSEVRQTIQARLNGRKQSTLQGLEKEMGNYSPLRREKFLVEFVAKAERLPRSATTGNFDPLVHSKATELDRSFEHREKLESLGRALVESSRGGTVPAGWRDDVRVQALTSPMVNEGCPVMKADALVLIEAAMKEHGEKIAQRAKLLTELAKFGVEFDGNSLDSTHFRVTEEDRIPECAIDDKTKLPADRDKCQTEMDRIGKERYAKLRILLREVSPLLPKGRQDPRLAAMGEAILGDAAQQFEERLTLRWYADGMRRMDQHFDPQQIKEPIEGAAVRVFRKSDGTFDISIWNLAQQREKASLIAQASRDAIKQHGVNLKELRKRTNLTLQVFDYWDKFDAKKYYDRLHDNVVAFRDRTEALDDFGGVSVQFDEPDPQQPSRMIKGTPLPSHYHAQQFELEYAHEVVTDTDDHMAKIANDEHMRRVAVGSTAAVTALYLVYPPGIVSHVLHGGMMGGGLHLAGAFLDTDVVPLAAGGLNAVMGWRLGMDATKPDAFSASQQNWGGVDGRGWGTLTGMATFALGNGVGAGIGKGLGLLKETSPLLSSRVTAPLVRFAGNETARQIAVMFGSSFLVNNLHARLKANDGGFKLTNDDLLWEPMLHATQTGLYMWAPDQRVAGMFNSYSSRFLSSYATNASMSVGLAYLDNWRHLSMKRSELDQAIQLGKKHDVAELTEEIKQLENASFATQSIRMLMNEVFSHTFFARGAALHAWQGAVQRGLHGLSEHSKPGAFARLQEQVRSAEESAHNKSPEAKGKPFDPNVRLGAMAAEMPQAHVQSLVGEAQKNPSGEAAKAVAVIAEHYKMTPERFIETFQQHAAAMGKFRPFGALGTWDAIQGSREGTKVPTAHVLPAIAEWLGKKLPGSLGRMAERLVEPLQRRRDPASISQHSLDPGKEFLALAEEKIEADLASATTAADQQRHIEDLVRVRPSAWARPEIRAKYSIDGLLAEVKAGKTLSPVREQIVAQIAAEIGLPVESMFKSIVRHYQTAPNEKLSAETIAKIVIATHKTNPAAQAELIRKGRLTPEAMSEIWEDPMTGQIAIEYFLMQEQPTWDAAACFAAYEASKQDFKTFYAGYKP